MISVVLLHLLSTFTLSHTLLTYISPLFLMSVRMLAGGVLALAAAFKTNRVIHIQKKHWFDVAQVILCALLVPYYLRYWALSVDSGVSYWYFTGLAVTYALSIWSGLEQFCFARISLILLSYASLYVVIGFAPLSLGLPAAVMFGSVVSFAYGWIIIRRCIVEYGLDPLVLNGLTLISAGIVSAGMCSFYEPFALEGNIFTCAIVLIAVILISNLLVHTWYMALLKRYSLTFMQLSSFIIPCWQVVWRGNASSTHIAASMMILGCCSVYYLIEQGVSVSGIQQKRLLRWLYNTGI